MRLLGLALALLSLVQGNPVQEAVGPPGPDSGGDSLQRSRTDAPRIGGRGAAPDTITSPADLWRGYDPTALPLEVETIQSWEEKGCRYEKLRFTGEIVNGGKVRVFAIQGAPKVGKSRPGILHIHGGGQTASLAWVKYWAERGYVCITFDFCGPWADRKEVTDWGPVTHANMAQAAGGFQVHPTPRESSWYHWTVAARRAITLLTQHPSVNPEKIGIFGISVGGNLTWMVAGSDKRVKAATAIYGSGYNYDRRKARWGFGDLSSDLALFKQTLSPEAHAVYVTCPLLHLDATNDFHAWLDYSDEILGAARGPVRQAFTPRYNHHIEPEQGADLARWMDWHLRGGKPFPNSPKVTIDLNTAGVPQAIVAPDHAADVQKVEVYYALGDKIPPARFWRRIETRRTERGKPTWEAALPVMDIWENLHVFTNVTYRSGVCLSSTQKHIIPAQLGPAAATLVWTPALAFGRDGVENWFYTAGYTDPNITSTYLRTGNDPVIGSYLTLNADLFGDPIDFTLSTHLVGDPQFTGKPGRALSFSVRGAFTGPGLTVAAIVNDWAPTARTYSARIEPGAIASGWQTIVLPLSRFVDPDGKPLPTWTGVERIELRGAASHKSPPCFAGFQWINTP